MLTLSINYSIIKVGGDSLLGEYWTPTTLLSQKDINGEIPEIYMVEGNRTAGKTYGMKKVTYRRAIKHNSQFVILMRFAYELSDCASAFFKDLADIDYPGFEMTSKCRCKGLYHELYVNDKHMGYALAISTSDALRKISPLFHDVNAIFMDEFQSEQDKYVSREVEKLQSIHTTIARGKGKQRRYLPIYMASNAVSEINPYYYEMGITGKLDDKTKILKGDGWVLERTFNENASKLLLESGVSRAFKNNQYSQFAANNVSLNDTKAFISKIDGNKSYRHTILYSGEKFGVWESEYGYLYVSHNVNESYPVKLSFTTKDHDINYIMLDKQDLLINKWRLFFKRGLFRFQDLRCRNVIMDIIAYR